MPQIISYSSMHHLQVLYQLQNILKKRPQIPPFSIKFTLLMYCFLIPVHLNWDKEGTLMFKLAWIPTTWLLIPRVPSQYELVVFLYRQSKMAENWTPIRENKITSLRKLCELKVLKSLETIYFRNIENCLLRNEARPVNQSTKNNFY